MGAGVESTRRGDPRSSRRQGRPRCVVTCASVPSLTIVAALSSCTWHQSRRGGRRPSPVTSQSAILQQHDGNRHPRRRLGSAIAAWGTRLIVGAPGDDERGRRALAPPTCSCAEDGAWMFEAKLAPVALRPGDAFGTSREYEAIGRGRRRTRERGVVTNDAGAPMGGSWWTVARRISSRAVAPRGRSRDACNRSCLRPTPGHR